jgi:hypothetical protein
MLPAQEIAFVKILPQPLLILLFLLEVFSMLGEAL